MPKSLGKQLLVMLSTWGRGLWNDLTGPVGYRGIALLIAAYVGLYSIMEARHERQINLAAYERNMLITLVSSGNRGSFVAAMKNFGPVQTMTIFTEPLLFEPWNWFEKTRPNVKPLHLWAQHRLKLCTLDECGSFNETPANTHKIDLSRANLRESTLADVDLSRSVMFLADLWRANLREADLHQSSLRLASFKEANLSGSNLRGVDLRGADLRGADLRGVNLENANLEGASLRGAIFGELHKHFHSIPSDSYQREIAGTRMKFSISEDESRAAVRFTGNLTGANLSRADMLGVRGLDCDRLTSAKNWDLACRDHALECNKSVPTDPCH